MGQRCIPIIIDNSIAENDAKVSALLEAMKMFAKFTCIRFQTRTNEKDYLRVIDGGNEKCYSFVGRVGGEQLLSIGSGCESQVGIIVHEMNHALGMLHEHQRPDRDEHVKVDYGAIKDGYDRNFEKYGFGAADTLELPYDYSSIMHYHAFAFTKDGRMTIVPNDFDAKDIMGQRDGFSACDLEKINKLYGCRIHNAPKCDSGPNLILTTSKPTSLAPEPETTTQRKTTIVSKASAKSKLTTTILKTSTTSLESATKTNETNETTTITTEKKQKPTKGPPIFPLPETQECRDEHPFCIRLASNQNLCILEPGIYMLKCKKSCKNCDGKMCLDGQGFPASMICGRYTPQQCGFSNVNNWCPASCGLC